MTDEHLSIANQGQGNFKDRGSKFHGYAMSVSDIEQVHSILKELKAQHPKSRHICYAYILGADAEQYRANDDGEPSGSAGLPILNAIKAAELKDVLVAVVRYFGGAKLGIPGLIYAYKTATQEAIENASIVTKYITVPLSIHYKHQDLGKLYALIKRNGITDIENCYENTPHLIINVPQSKASTMKKQLYADYHGYAITDIEDDFLSDGIKIQIVES